MARTPQGLPLEPPLVDAFMSSMEPDVTHFLYLEQFRAGARGPILSTYDLNHEHLPHLFSSEYIAYRRMLYDAAARDHAPVIAASEFTARDIRNFHPGLAESLEVIPLAPYVDPSQHGTGSAPQGLPPTFILYPAFSYEHKNHLGLLQALSIAAARGFDIPLVCTGGQSQHWDQVVHSARQIAPAARYLHVGSVSLPELVAIYKAARFVVFPSRFEGVGLPLLEAGAMGRAIACSDLEVFREFGGNAPVYFDPASPDDMARAIIDLWTDDKRAGAVAFSMSRQVQHLTWDQTARRLEAAYLRAAAAGSLQ